MNDDEAGVIWCVALESKHQEWSERSSRDKIERLCWLLPLKLKSDCLVLFSQFIKYVELLHLSKISMVQSDGGDEFLSKRFTDLLVSLGISHRVSCPHTPQQNGVAEQKHQTISQIGRCFLNQAYPPSNYCLHSFLVAAFVSNRLVSPVTNGKSPYEILFERTPDYSIL